MIFWDHLNILAYIYIFDIYIYFIYIYNKLTILEKLEQAKNKLNELDSEIVETSQTSQIHEYELPRYITMKKKPNDKIQLIYDRKLNGKRQGMRLTIKNISEKNLDEEVKKFQEAIEEKYS